ncbi:hypothetical protein LguiA_016989 [Lonicera macranthoides]
MIPKGTKGGEAFSEKLKSMLEGERGELFRPYLVKEVPAGNKHVFWISKQVYNSTSSSSCTTTSITYG